MLQVLFCQRILKNEILSGNPTSQVQDCFKFIEKSAKKPAYLVFFLMGHNNIKVSSTYIDNSFTSYLSAFPPSHMSPLILM